MAPAATLLNSRPIRRISPLTQVRIPIAMTNPFQFLQQTRNEVAKVAWPTRREVLLTTVMVFILSALAATFFSLVDLAIRTGLNAIVGV
jgi:preprotein translocase subunit SecE